MARKFWGPAQRSSTPPPRHSEAKGRRIRLPRPWLPQGPHGRRNVFRRDPIFAKSASLLFTPSVRLRRTAPPSSPARHGRQAAREDRGRNLPRPWTEGKRQSGRRGRGPMDGIAAHDGALKARPLPGSPIVAGPSRVQTSGPGAALDGPAGGSRPGQGRKGDGDHD